MDGSFSFRTLRNFHDQKRAGNPKLRLPLPRYVTARFSAITEEPRMNMNPMKKTLAVAATVAAVGAAAVAAPSPAEAHGRGIGPGLAFGLAAGAITAGALAATSPYYGPYGYYGPPAYTYAPGPYAYYGGPVYYHRYYRPYRNW
jgi:hypothetical protein